MNQSAVNLLDTLTEHEVAVFDLVFEGLSRPKIAEKLCISLGTVGYHLEHVYRKLGVSNSVEAVRYASSAGKVIAPKVCGKGWDEAQIREAAAELVKQGLADRKQVNAIITELLITLKEKKQ